MYMNVNGRSFKVLKNSTNQAQSFIQNHARATITNIMDAYKNPSIEKQKAFFSIWRWSKQLEKPTNVYITSKNTSTFSASVEGTVNGERVLFYFTAYNSYIIVK